MTDGLEFVIGHSSCLNLHFRFGFAEAGNPLAFLPLAPFFEQFNPLKAFEYVSFAAQEGRRAQASML